MSALRELVATFTTRFDTKPLKKGDNAINTVIGGLTKLGAVAGVTLGAGALWRGLQGLSDEADQLVKTADNFGTTAEKLQAWQHVAGRAGVASEVMQNAFRKVSKSILDAELGSKAATDAFSMIGLSVEELSGKAPEEQLLRIGVALSKVEDISKRNAIATQLLGRRGAVMNKMFKDPALGEQLKHYEKLAPVTEEQARDFEVMNDAMGDVNMLMRRVAFTIAAFVAPAISKLALTFTYLSNETHVFETLKVLVIAAAAAFTTVMLPALFKTAAAWVVANAPMLLWIATAALVGLAIEDLITFFEGGESVIGSVIENLFGKKTRDFIAGWGKWLIHGGPLSDIGRFVNDVVYMFENLGQTINDVLGFFGIGNSEGQSVSVTQGGGTGGTVSAPGTTTTGGTTNSNNFGGQTVIVNAPPGASTDQVLGGVTNALDKFTQKNSGMMAALANKA